MDEADGNWKLELRYGRQATPFRHFTVLADGVAGTLADGFECVPGPAIMSMKAWAGDADEAIDMAGAIGRQIGFSVAGKVEVYETEPEAPPGEHPHGYDIRFYPYDGQEQEEGED